MALHLQLGTAKPVRGRRPSDSPVDVTKARQAPAFGTLTRPQPTAARVGSHGQVLLPRSLLRFLVDAHHPPLPTHSAHEPEDCCRSRSFLRHGPAFSGSPQAS